MKCPKCGRNDNIRYRVKFYDDDEKGTFYIRVDGSRDSTKKVKWYDDFFEALDVMKHKLPCAYPYFKIVEAICCNEFLFSDGHIDSFHKEGIEINKYQQRLDKVLSKMSLTNDGKSYEICDLDIVFDIDYITKENTFYMVYGTFDSSNNWQEYMNIISLDTVENLIKDLEVI